MTLFDARANERKINWLGIGPFFIALGLVSTALSKSIASPTWVTFGAYCSIAVLALTGFLLASLYRNTSAILLDARVLFAVCFILMQIGNAGMAVGPDYVFDTAQNSYPIDPAIALRVFSINTIGFGIALGVAGVTKTNFVTNVVESPTLSQLRLPISGMVYALLLIGAIARLRVSWNDLFQGEVVISGIWRALALVIVVALFLGIIHCKKLLSPLGVLCIATAVASSSLGLAGFNKTETILPIFAVAAGIGLRRNSILILILALSGSLSLVSVLGDAVLYGREKVTPQTSYLERLELTQAEIARTTSHSENKYSAWSRLNDIAAQSAAIDFYDKGFGSDDLPKLLWVFVPRALAPGKPIMTETGSELYYRITGNYGSSVSTGIFVDGYYNAGWPGVALGSALCGWIVAVVSAMGKSILRQGNYLLAPVLIMCYSIAASVGGAIISAFVGAFVIVMWFLIIIWLFAAFLRPAKIQNQIR